MTAIKDIQKNMRSSLDKIVVNVGVGRLSQQQNFESKALVQIKRDLGLITGQAPHERKARKSIAGFKMREGQIVGLRITLRGQRMVDFLNRLVMIVLPRVRDFKGISTEHIDEGGTLNIGIREHQVFPEIHPEESPISFSLQISVVPQRKKREEALAALRSFGVPFKK